MQIGLSLYPLKSYASTPAVRLLLTVLSALAPQYRRPVRLSLLFGKKLSALSFLKRLHTNSLLFYKAIRCLFSFSFFIILNSKIFSRFSSARRRDRNDRFSFLYKNIDF